MVNPPAAELDDVAGDWLRRLRAALMRWHARHGRNLPWRGVRDPYRVWISEIMLQQTTVAAVKSYYERFLQRFPTIGDLAAAPLDDVLKLWEGLGYYSRARNLHRTAAAIVAQWDGQFPASLSDLQTLPGIGRYTAGAILSFALNRPAPIVEANTLRLYSRLLGYAGDPRSTGGQRLLWEFAERLVPARDPGAFNQALIDLGATVCTPVAPTCPDCPLKTSCAAFATQQQHVIPRPPTRAAITELTEVAVIVRRGTRVLLRRCLPGERWAGLWDFPRFTLPDALAQPRSQKPFAAARSRSSRSAPGISGLAKTQRPRTSRAAVTDPEFQLTPQFREHAEQAVRAASGIHCEVQDLMTELRHTVTRYRIHLLVVAARPRSGRTAVADETVWVPISDLSEYALSTTGREIARRLADQRPGRE